MGTSPSTVQRWASGTSPVNLLLVLRSHRLAERFVRNVLVLVETRNHRSAGHVTPGLAVRKRARDLYGVDLDDWDQKLPDPKPGNENANPNVVDS